jgi:hypothetical protein
LEKLKSDKFIVQKGLDFNNYNWRQSIEYLKENLSGDELLNVLYSIESKNNLTVNSMDDGKNYYSKNAINHKKKGRKIKLTNI